MHLRRGLVVGDDGVCAVLVAQDGEDPAPPRPAQQAITPHHTGTYARSLFPFRSVLQFF